MMPLVGDGISVGLRQYCWGLDLRNETDPSQSGWERENAQGYGFSNHDHARHPSPFFSFAIHSFSSDGYSPPHHRRILGVIVAKW